MKLLAALFMFAAFNQAAGMRLWDRDWSWFWNWGSVIPEDVYNTEDVITPLAEVTQECLRLAGWGQCAFYDCLEERFSCGENAYTTKISKHFCSKIDRNYNSFDVFGRLWLNRTSVCLLSHMLPIYNADSTSCAAIKDAGIQSILDCNAATVNGNDFCHFLGTNNDAYSALMGTEEVRLMLSLRDPGVLGSMITQAVRCGVTNLAVTVSNIGSSISGYAGSFYDSVLGWFSS